jgi:nucleoside-diphosphate-sugar epimerase
VRAVIPTIILQALERDYIELGALDPQRDMTFVTDTCVGLMEAAIKPGILGETINLGTGETFSIADLVYRILRLMKIDKPVITKPARIRPQKSEVQRLVSNNSRAHRLLDWAPQVSLEDGLSQTIEFFDKHRRRYVSDAYTL